MKVLDTQPTLQCDLNEFWEEFVLLHKSGPDKNTLLKNVLPETRDALRNIRTRSAKYEVEIKGQLIQFNSRELVCRFISLPLETQFNFIGAVWYAMRTNKVKRIEMRIPWAKNKDTTIVITQEEKFLHIGFR